MKLASEDDKASVHSLVTAACEAQRSDRHDNARRLLSNAERVIIQLSARGDSSYAYDAWNELTGVRVSLGF